MRFQLVRLYCMSFARWRVYSHTTYAHTLIETHTHRMLSALISAAFRTAVECKRLTSDPQRHQAPSLPPPPVQPAWQPPPLYKFLPLQLRRILLSVWFLSKQEFWNFQTLLNSSKCLESRRAFWTTSFNWSMDFSFFFSWPPSFCVQFFSHASCKSVVSVIRSLPKFSPILSKTREGGLGVS